MTREEIRRFREQGSWRNLLALAQEMTADAQRHSGGVQLNAQLGGGTRLMLALDHRISNDIDLFIRDPQWIGFLTPRLNDRFRWELTPRDLFDWKAVCDDPRYSRVPSLMRDLPGEDKRSAIKAALQNNSKSQSATARWNAIQAAEKPSMQDGIAWAMGQLAD